jgi:hypothetical protein
MFGCAATNRNWMLTSTSPDRLRARPPSASEVVDGGEPYDLVAVDAVVLDAAAVDGKVGVVLGNAEPGGGRIDRRYARRISAMRSGIEPPRRGLPLPLLSQPQQRHTLYAPGAEAPKRQTLGEMARPGPAPPRPRRPQLALHLATVAQPVLGVPDRATLALKPGRHALSPAADPRSCPRSGGHIGDTFRIRKTSRDPRRLICWSFSKRTTRLELATFGLGSPP